MAQLALKVNKSLIDYKFEGYKLSLNPIPVLQQPVVDGVNCIELNSDEFSYLQTRMALLQNYLFHDQFFQNSVFYVNKKGNMLWTSLEQDGRLAVPRCIWSIPTGLIAGEAVTTVFPSEEWALVCHEKTLYILNTISRSAGEPWTCAQMVTLEAESTCYLLHSTHRCTPVGMQIDFILATVENKAHFPEKALVPEDCSFVSVLQWISLSCAQNNNSWIKKRIRKFGGPSFPEYASLDNIGDAICIVSKNDYKMYSDTDGVVNISSDPVKKNDRQSPKYTYIQTPDDISVYFRLPEDAQKHDFQIIFQPTHLEVLFKGKRVLSGQLENCIDRDSCSWIINKDRLEVYLFKAEVGLMWRELIKGDQEGEELMDKALVEEIHNRLAHLTSENEVTPSNQVPFNLDQLEECDSSTEELFFQRIDGNEHTETHKAILSGHQWLFSKHISPDSLPSICLRHDIDGILWEPKNVVSEGNVEQFKMEHSATFSALGYVLASKTDKKFITSAPNFDYAVISDCARHLYLYFQPESLHSSLELRNRKTGEAVARIAKQYVISLENCDKILGLQASSDCIFVLSAETLYAVKVSSK